MTNQQTIYVQSDTIPRGDVYNHTRRVIDLLYFPHEPLTVYIDVVDTIPFCFASSLANGVCVQKTPTTYLIFIKYTDNWRNTLSHELYHVSQFTNDMPLCERECNQFATLMDDANDANGAPFTHS